MILIRLFKDNRSGGPALWIIFLLALFLFSIFQSLQAEEITALDPIQGMPFYTLIFGQVHQLPVLSYLLSLLLVLLTGAMLNRIAFRYLLLENRSFMPGIFFLLFAFALPSTRPFSPTLVSTPFFLLSFATIFNVKDNRTDTYSLFHAALLLMLGCMFSLKLIWFLPLLYFSLWTLRPSSWREWVYPLVAVFLLFLFLFTWYWGVRENPEALRSLLASNLAFPESSLSEGSRSFHYSTYLLYGFLLLLVGLSSIYMVKRFQARKTSTQNLYQVFFYMFVTGLLYFIFIARFDPFSLVYIAIPVAYILSNYFFRRRNPWTHELALWIALGLLVWVQIIS